MAIPYRGSSVVDAAFMVFSLSDTAELELFRYEVFKMLKSKDKINEIIVENI